jgi:hypothetical protein
MVIDGERPSVFARYIDQPKKEQPQGNPVDAKPAEEQKLLD